MVAVIGPIAMDRSPDRALHFPTHLGRHDTAKESMARSGPGSLGDRLLLQGVDVRHYIVHRASRDGAYGLHLASSGGYHLL